ncbi:MAG TPA: hypothetical protein VNT56_08345 [Acidimicrobiales bacterium]|nr:hypothetical protein [Acidimicrobiales bacterium]
MGPPSADDEDRHCPPADQAGWEESWDLSFATAGAALGGYARLTLDPGHRRAWYWAALVGRGRPLVIVVDHDLAPPRGRALDLRGEGLWTSLTCETPLEHWSVGLEAFGVALDDPAEAWRSLRGDRAPLGLDLEWEVDGTAWPAPHPEGYHLPARVHGEVLVGEETLAVDGTGGVTHAWGIRGWGRAWSFAAARLDDGTGVAGPLDGPPPAAGPSGPPGLPGPGRAALALGDGRAPLGCAIAPLYHAPVAVEGPDGAASRLARSLCRYTLADGRGGVGWVDRNWGTAGAGGT